MRFAADLNPLARLLDAVVLQPMHFVMETGVLQRVKARTEEMTTTR